jgi:hypothetical protein
MATKLKINKKDPPEKEPIIVSNPNDPRLRAYQDSLALTKGPMESYRKAQTINKLIKQGYFDEARRLNNSDYTLNTEGYKAFKRLSKYNKKEPKPVKGSELGWGLSPSDDAFPVYKKPVQKVVYKKPEAKKEEKPEPKKEEQKPVKGVVFSKKPELLVDKSGNYGWFYENPEGDLIQIRRATAEEIKSVKK